MTTRPDVIDFGSPSMRSTRSTSISGPAGNRTRVGKVSISANDAPSTSAILPLAYVVQSSKLKARGTSVRTRVTRGWRRCIRSIICVCNCSVAMAVCVKPSLTCRYFACASAATSAVRPAAVTNAERSIRDGTTAGCHNGGGGVCVSRATTSGGSSGATISGTNTGGSGSRYGTGAPVRTTRFRDNRLVVVGVWPTHIVSIPYSLPRLIGTRSAISSANNFSTPVAASCPAKQTARAACGRSPRIARIVRVHDFPGPTSTNARMPSR